MLRKIYEKLEGTLIPDSLSSADSAGKYQHLYYMLIPFLVVLTSMLFRVTGIYFIDSDQFWSLAVGQWIVEHGTVPTVDTFSWTVQGLPWRSNSWLFCWMIYMIDFYWGMYGVAVMIFLVYLVTAYIILAMCIKLNRANIAIWIFTIGMFALVYFSATPRAYIFTFVFLAAIIYLIRFKRDTWLIYLIPLIFIFWVNIQTSVRFGIALIFVEAVVGTVFYKDRRLWPVLILSFLATLVNPYGLSIWEWVLSLGSWGGAVSPGTQYISEWQPPNFSDRGILLRYGIAGITAVIASYGAVISYYKTKVIDRDKLMVFFWFWAMFFYAMTMVRASHYMLLLWIPYFAAFTPKWLQNKMRLRPILIVVLMAALIFNLYIKLPQQPLFRANQITVPAGALEYLLENPEAQHNLFNDYIFGGFLLANGIKVFIDARGSVYIENSVMEDYVNLTNLRVNPQEIIDKYDIQSFHIRTGRPLMFYLVTHPNWEPVYVDNASVIFIKK